MRARIVLLATEGRRNGEIQQRLGVSKPVVATLLLNGSMDWPTSLAGGASASMMPRPDIGLRPQPAVNRPLLWERTGAWEGCPNTWVSVCRWWIECCWRNRSNLIRLLYLNCFNQLLDFRSHSPPLSVPAGGTAHLD